MVAFPLFDAQPRSVCGEMKDSLNSIWYANVGCSLRQMNKWLIKSAH